MPTLSRDDRARDLRRADDTAPLGPYETAYDVRRGYDAPLPRRPWPGEEDEHILLFRGRDPNDDGR
jgi:hypothetical protein